MNKWVLIGVLLLGLVLAFGWLQNAASARKTASTVQEEALQTNSSGLQWRDDVVGTGRQAKAGDVVEVHYTGTLYPSGKKFDSSRDRNEPFTFTLDARQVIAGWDEGVAGMKIGGQRTLVIPPDLAYGPMGMPPVIPENATLKFEIELMAID